MTSLAARVYSVEVSHRGEFTLSSVTRLDDRQLVVALKLGS